MLFMTSTAVGQISTYRGTHISYQNIDEYGNNGEWSKWYETDALVTFNFNTDVIKIYLDKTQVLRILAHKRAYKDSEGGTQTEWTMVDQDGDYGRVRLRFERSGRVQLYVDYSSFRYVIILKTD